MTRLLTLFTNLFPLWVLAACGAALLRPALFTWFDQQWIVWGLAMIMLGMGLTLRAAEPRLRARQVAGRGKARQPAPTAPALASPFRMATP